MDDQGLRQIALYGKGGIGKSMVACNLSIALTELGRKVMQVGCSPKIDSTAFLIGGEPPDWSILDYSREVGVSERTALDVIVIGYKDIVCVEAGGPDPAEGCAGRGVSMALDLLKDYDIAGKFGVNFVIYDVIGDVVCGGFAQPMRGGYANNVYLVSSGELMSLYSSNNICKAIVTMNRLSGDIGVAGLINNMRGVAGEVDLVNEFADRVGIPILANIPRSDIIQEAESQGGTVLEKFPDSDVAGIFRGLADTVLNNPQKCVPKPLELEDIMALISKYNLAD